VAQDIPYIDKEVEKLPEDVRESLADMGRTNLMFFAKGILGYKDMTEKCHGPFVTFLEQNRKQFKMALMPRDHYKTSAGTVAGNLQKAVKDPNERILICNETSTNAERMLGAIKGHCETNTIFRGLYSDVIPKDLRKTKWNNSEAQFNRQWIGPEPTFDTIGMVGAATSRHYTHLCYDDPISEDAVQSDKVMKDAINRMSAMTALLVKPEYNTVWLIGTRWALHDVYSWYRKNFKDRLGILARSVTEDGEIIFPELISPEMLAIKRKVMGEYKYSCLMMNNPRNEDIQDLNVQDIQWYRWSEDQTKVVLLNDEMEVIDVWRLDQLDITVTVDPAPAETVTSDRNAIVTCGISPRNQCIVLDVYARREKPYEVISYLIGLYLRFRPRVFGIEGVAYQKVLKYVLDREAQRLGIYLRIQELKAPGKHKQHVKGLQPIMKLKRLFCHPSQQLLLQEMSDFPLGEHDDTADALGLQPQLWKGRLSPEHLEKVEAEARRFANRIQGYSLKDDPGASREFKVAMQLADAEDEHEPECDWEEVPIQ